MIKKTDVYSFVAVVICSIALALLVITGPTVHMAISALALIIILVSTISGCKTWKVSALEITYRVLYLITLGLGVMMKFNDLDSLKLIHIVTFILFVVVLVITFVESIKRSTHKKRRI